MRGGIGLHIVYTKRMLYLFTWGKMHSINWIPTSVVGCLFHYVLCLNHYFALWDMCNSLAKYGTGLYID